MENWKVLAFKEKERGEEGVRKWEKFPLKSVNLTDSSFLVDLSEEIIQYPKSCRMLSLNCILKIPVYSSKQFFYKRQTSLLCPRVIVCSMETKCIKGQQSSSLDKMLLIFLESK